MEAVKRTIIGDFANLDNARKAKAELLSAGFHDVRLVENEYQKTVPPQTKAKDQDSDSRGFFARLFGYDDGHPTRKLSYESETFFGKTFQKKHHILIVTATEDADRCIDIIRSFGGDITEEAARLYEQEIYASRSFDTEIDEEQVLELREERLEVGKDRMQAGELQLRKEIVTETKTVEIPLTREEIVVERRSLDGVDYKGDLATYAFGDQKEIRIPVSEEKVHIEKKVVPREEIRITKQRIIENEVVSEEVRHEEARIESQGRVMVKTRDERIDQAKPRPNNGAPMQPGL